jgi:hypothetical protein
MGFAIRRLIVLCLSLVSVAAMGATRPIVRASDAKVD